MPTNGFDPMAQYARLSERVENQGKDIVDLRSNMNTGFQTVNAGLSALSNEMRSSSKTQWPVIWAAAGVCFTVLVTIGTFFYGTLSKGQDRLDLAVAKMGETTVSQAEMKWRTDRAAEDRIRTDTAIKDLRESQVPRQELERVWQSDDQQKAQIQKQIDELKQGQANTYSARDLLLDMRERQDRLERQIYASRPAGQ
ncbi:hypothetical protein HGP16_25590 [Rhizobium sp. P40RR-XXII]|uniref:hypothetical protein n=1 Tax=Rhizobium sp. P40RR-XXII TaxID=2726739 RepID=UPI0014567501|nr:hypothetical protein [Rhizobium sp. P40RR-XXII]NLS19916.1 hypothetical protein [Rhizobium sp. P40RR-XXII]